MIAYVYSKKSTAEAHLQRVNTALGYPCGSELQGDGFATNVITESYATVLQHPAEEKWAIVRDENTKASYTSGATVTDITDWYNEY